MKLRGGEVLLGSGALALIAVLFLDWFAIGEEKSSGWRELSLPVLFLIAVAVIVAALLLLAVQRGDSIAHSVGLSVAATVAAIVMTVAVIADVISITGGDTDARWPAVAGMLFAAAMTLGSWRAMGDERLDAADSVYTPPEPRATPGP